MHVKADACISITAMIGQLCIAPKRTRLGPKNTQALRHVNYMTAIQRRDSFFNHSRLEKWWFIFHTNALLQFQLGLMNRLMAFLSVTTGPETLQHWPASLMVRLVLLVNEFLLCSLPDTWSLSVTLPSPRRCPGLVCLRKRCNPTTDRASRYMRWYDTLINHMMLTTQ